jgi:hypothetical protein
MIEITLPLVLQILQTAGILVGIIYYITIMRNTQKTRELTLQSQELTRKAQEQALETRQAQLYNNIWNQSINNLNWMKNFLIITTFEWNTLDEYLETCPWGDFTSENNMAMWQVGMFFEGLSPLVKNKLINLDYFFPTYYSMLQDYWGKVEPIIAEARERLGQENWTESEYLYNVLTEHLKKHPELYPYP